MHWYVSSVSLHMRHALAVRYGVRLCLLQAARLLALFREFKRREAVGLVPFYAHRLAALEDSLLGARDRLFNMVAAAEAAPPAPSPGLNATMASVLGGAASAGYDPAHPSDDLLDALAMLSKLEKEVG